MAIQEEKEENVNKSKLRKKIKNKFIHEKLKQTEKNSTK